ncbi:hypothetical protein [Actinoplanes sp. NBRC 101535]|uniref:hypothetical protein n=1 Tax=Actinoplanes sp. NBRC 101535 TaxID=3032196 RepID=UPI0024A37B12|nr:hypothetical protein [Actinoplanes sp. NBRC 101535]GLY08729.1 hypothetical protein Acsp01_91080 [Actinoplanes sp. NBRC 101535]
MLLLDLFILVMLILAVYAVLPAFRSSSGEGDPAGQAEGEAPAVAPTTLEGALTGQLVRGEITRRQYRHALERLAARDDEVRPMTVPEKGDPSGSPS